MASAEGFKHAVLAVHEFRTDARPKDKAKVNDRALELFSDVVLGLQLAGNRTIPWCQHLRDVVGVDARLYLAHVATDLTTETLKSAPA